MSNDLIVLVVLALLEVILGLDNVIFISLLASRIPERSRALIRILGLSLALVMRIAILFAVSWILSMTKPIIFTPYLDLSVKDLIMSSGGILLTYKSIKELLHSIIGTQEQAYSNLKSQFFFAVLQIIIIDLIFSIDSILTAVALTQNIKIISLAFVITMIAMIFLAKHITDLIQRHPNIKTIAIVFVLGIGLLLIAEGLHVHISKNYVYVSFFFALIIESLNIIRIKYDKNIDDQQ